ncbi:hypothetical protein NUM3379_12050 [Kineococcus sp. NUM-3379]
MTTVGLRELRNQASDLLRRVEDLFPGAADPTREQDRALVSSELADPWAQR